MTVAELLRELADKPLTYEVKKAGVSAEVVEVATDHEKRKVFLW